MMASALKSFTCTHGEIATGVALTASEPACNLASAAAAASKVHARTAPALGARSAPRRQRTQCVAAAADQRGLPPCPASCRHAVQTGRGQLGQTSLQRSGSGARAAGQRWHSNWAPAAAPAARWHGPRGHHWLPGDDDQGRLGALLAAAVGGACHCRTPLLAGHHRCPGGAARGGTAAGPAAQAGRLLEGGCHCDHAADGLLPDAAGSVAGANCSRPTPGNVSGGSRVAGG